MFQSLSRVLLFATPWIAARQASFSITISSSVVPFSPCFQSFQASGSFLLSQVFASGGQSSGGSASASILPVNSGLIFFRIDWFDLLAVQGTLKSILQQHSSKASVLWCSAFFMVQLSHTSVGDYWRNHSFKYLDLCQQSNVSAF